MKKICIISLLAVLAFFSLHAQSSATYSPSNNNAVTILWEGHKTINWNKAFVSLAPELFTGTQSGARINLIIESPQVGSIAGLRTGSWGSLPGATSDIKISGIYCSYIVSREMADALSKDGLIVTGGTYTLKSVEIVNADLLPKVEASVDSSLIKVYRQDEIPELRLKLKNASGSSATFQVTTKLLTDSSNTLSSHTETINLAPGEQGRIYSYAFPGLAPGFYRVSVAANHGSVAEYCFGYDIFNIVSEADQADDFDEFWANALDDLAAVPINPKLTLIPEKCTAARNVYLLEMQSAPEYGSDEPVIIRAHYAEPVTPGKYPVLIGYQGYNIKGNTYCPSGDENKGFVEIRPYSRGQGLNCTPPLVSPYGRCVDWGLSSQLTYYYRGAYLDAMRALDFILTRQCADPTAIFAQGESQGGAYSIIAAALGNGKFTAIAPAIPAMGDFPDYLTMSDWPTIDILNYQQIHGMEHDEMLKIMSYFDIKNFAGRMKCPVLMTVSLQDQTCPPHTNMAPYNLLPADINKELLINNFHKHTIPSERYRDFMNFFLKVHEDNKNSSTDSVTSGKSDGPIEIYTISGSRIFSGHSYAEAQLPAGIYIIKQGSEVRKAVVRD